MNETRSDTNEKPRVAVLTLQERLRLRAETLCAEETVEAWARGESVRPSTDARLREAAARLGITVPVNGSAA